MSGRRAYGTLIGIRLIMLTLLLLFDQRKEEVKANRTGGMLTMVPTVFSCDHQ